MKLFSLFATLSLDTGEFVKNINSAETRAGSFMNTVGKIGKTLTITATALAGTATAFVATLGKVGFAYNQQIENYTANFKTLLGSAEAATQRVEELKEKAAKTPFSLADLAGATETLLTFNVDASKTNGILSMLGDVALGNKEKLSSLALVFGQVSSAGKLTGQDLLQFINVGFNPLNYIAERTGESMDALRKRMSAGKVSVQEVTQAFVDATSEGGKFYKGTEEASKTNTGLWSTLSDDWQAFLGRIMEPVNEEARNTVTPALIRNLEKLSTAIFGVDEAQKSLFKDSEGNEINPASNLKTWLEDLMTVWTDGKSEDNAIVQSFVSDFKSNTTAIQNALVERIQNVTGTYTEADVAQAQKDLEQISEMQAEVERLLAKRQNGMITADEEEKLNQMVLALENMQTKLAGAEGIDQKVVTPWERFVQTVARLATEKLDSVTDWIVTAVESGDLSETIDGWGRSLEGIAKAFSAIYTIVKPLAVVIESIGHGLGLIAGSGGYWSKILEPDNLNPKEIKPLQEVGGALFQELGKTFFGDSNVDTDADGAAYYNTAVALRGKMGAIYGTGGTPASLNPDANADGFAQRIGYYVADSLRNSPIQVETNVDIDGYTAAKATAKSSAKIVRGATRAAALGVGQ